MQEQKEHFFKRDVDIDEDVLVEAVELYADEFSRRFGKMTLSAAKSGARKAVVNKFGADVVDTAQFSGRVGNVVKSFRDKAKSSKEDSQMALLNGSRVVANREAAEWFVSLHLQPGQSITICPSLLARISGHSPDAWRNPFYSGQKIQGELGYVLDATGNDDQFTVTVVEVPGVKDLPPSPPSAIDDAKIHALIRMMQLGHEQEAQRLLDVIARGA